MYESVTTSSYRTKSNNISTTKTPIFESMIINQVLPDLKADRDAAASAEEAERQRKEEEEALAIAEEKKRLAIIEAERLAKLAQDKAAA